MEIHASPAEELPALYRAILDGVARLEDVGQRREAASVRSQATAVYSNSWNDQGRRRLIQLQRRIDRAMGTGDPDEAASRTWRPLQRTVDVR
jgi:hypothetical protein